jgi:hypothetical protein
MELTRLALIDAAPSLDLRRIGRPLLIEGARL